MPWRADPQPTTRVWHGIGLTAYLSMLSLYAAAGYFHRAGVSPRFYWALGGAVAVAVAVAFVGRLSGWQQRRALLSGWPVAALLATALVGAVEPSATRNFPGTITITFAYVGLTCPRCARSPSSHSASWRSSSAAVRFSRPS